MNNLSSIKVEINRIINSFSKILIKSAYRVIKLNSACSAVTNQLYLLSLSCSKIFKQKFIFTLKNSLLLV